MAFAAAHIVGISIAAGLVAGTGAVASHLISSAPATTTTASSAAATIGRPCATQTWPYIDQSCLGSVSEARRKIRLIAAPSGIEPVSYAAAEPAAPAPAEPELVTGDTVLRQPQRIATTGADAAEKALPPKPKVKRATQSRERGYAQSYQVPAETRGATDIRPVIVVRPISVEYIRPCDDRRC
jgi:hypothetical protein